jgi:hypothetical protein
MLAHILGMPSGPSSGLGISKAHGQSLIRVFSPRENDSTHLGHCWVQPDGLVAHVKIKGCHISEAF